MFQSLPVETSHTAGIWRKCLHSQQHQENQCVAWQSYSFKNVGILPLNSNHNCVFVHVGVSLRLMLFDSSSIFYQFKFVTIPQRKWRRFMKTITGCTRITFSSVRVRQLDSRTDGRTNRQKVVIHVSCRTKEKKCQGMKITQSNEKKP